MNHTNPNFTQIAPHSSWIKSYYPGADSFTYHGNTGDGPETEPMFIEGIDQGIVSADPWCICYCHSTKGEMLLNQPEPGNKGHTREDQASKLNEIAESCPNGTRAELDLYFEKHGEEC